MLNRRSFLSSLTGIAATLALDPEKLFWVPGKKLISIPKPQSCAYWPVFSTIDRTILNDMQHRYDACVSAQAELINERLRFCEGYAWPIEEISASEFSERYPDAGR